MIEGGGVGRRSCFVGHGAVGVDGVLAGDGGFWVRVKDTFFWKKTKNWG